MRICALAEHWGQAGQRRGDVQRLAHLRTILNLVSETWDTLDEQLLTRGHQLHDLVISFQKISRPAHGRTWDLW